MHFERILKYGNFLSSNLHNSQGSYLSGRKIRKINAHLNFPSVTPKAKQILNGVYSSRELWS